MRALAAVALALLCAAPAAAIDLDRYARILEAHTRAVEDTAGTRVDYAALRGPAAADWSALVASVSAVDPETLLGDTERLAFWINAYNVFAIDLVVKGNPETSIRDLGSWLFPVWKRTAGTVGGEEVTLDRIEHGILRPLGDPRIHGAIVCASLSCPSLLREPWRADALDAQFERALSGWLRDPRKGVRIEREAGRVWLSRIFDWFEEDFEPDGALAFAARYLPETDRAFLLERSRAEALRIRYLDYDWSLNRLRSNDR